MFFLPLICLLPLLTPCSTSWAPLTPADYLLASTLDPKVDHVDLFPGTGGPRQGNSSRTSVWQIWPQGRIPYRLDDKFSASDRAMIAAAILELEEQTCLRFLPAEDESLPRMDILGDDHGGFCHTRWDTDGQGGTLATVHLTPNSACTVPRTIQHELMHGVAFYHTHTREDRDEHVFINWENILPEQRGQFEPCQGCCCQTWGNGYDCGSVMHYARDQMSSNGEDTITSLTDNLPPCYLPKFTEWNHHQPRLSQGDIDMVQQQYGDYCHLN